METLVSASSVSDGCTCCKVPAAAGDRVKVLLGVLAALCADSTVLELMTGKEPPCALIEVISRFLAQASQVKPCSKHLKHQDGTCFELEIVGTWYLDCVQNRGPLLATVANA